jgi:aminoglycoside phosphotransferase (APT) family kinase protein
VTVAGPAAEPEQERNARLRRADWRVLLSKPRPERVLCLTGGALADAVGEIAGTIVDAREAVRDPCDLVVARDPDVATLAHAAKALRSGGSCYCEWHRPQRGGLSGIRRRLKQAGFDDVTSYWAWPPPGRLPSVWIPLEGDGAIRWFRETRTPSRSWGRRALHLVRRTGWRLARNAGLLLPVCTVAVKGSPGGLWAELARGDAATRLHGGPASVLLLTGGPRSISKIVGLVFAEPDPAPRLAVKLARTEDARRALEREADALRALERLRPTLPGVPRVVFERRDPEVPLLAETVVAGVPLFERIAPNTYAGLAMAGTQWLVHLAGPPRPVPRSTWWPRFARPVVEQFELNFQSVVDEDRRAASRAVMAAVGDLPVVFEHGDFAPWNLFIDERDGLGVLDWESSRSEGLPGLDILYFLTYHSFFLEGAVESPASRAAYRACFDPSTPTGRVSAACLDRYASAVGVPHGSWAGLRLLLWMQKSAYEHRRLLEDAGGTPDRPALQESLFFGLWEEELARARSPAPTA